ncbi:hypothetical protein [Flavobacterium sp.]|uniref:hypothetical protein n=1 Tax=Flavobacterium sp. TaxID=239 RepID=UPI00261A7A23|nr:hypothetical protein [Flavobacterium sp.]
MGILFILSGILIFFCVVCAVVGFVQVFSKDEKTKKFGVKLLQFAAIGIIIGFSTCAVLIN